MTSKDPSDGGNSANELRDDALAHRTWIRGHWSFFVFIQTAIVALTRLKDALAMGEKADAERSFNQATLLMLGSAAAMRMAGDVNRESYQQAVIPSMKARREKFSGTDSSDHAELIRAYQALTAPLADLPQSLTLAHQRFVAAVRTAKAAHKYVCADHGGNERTSTGSGSKTELTGVETLEKLGNHRIAMVSPDPAKSAPRCPFHS